MQLQILGYTCSCWRLQGRVECCFERWECLWSRGTASHLKPWSLCQESGSVSGPQSSRFSFLIHLAPLFFPFLISFGLDHDAHQAEVNAAAGEVLWSQGESAQQSWLWSSSGHIHAVLVSGWEGETGFILPGRLLSLTNCTPTLKCHSTDVSGLLPLPRHKISLPRFDEGPTVGGKVGWGKFTWWWPPAFEKVLWALTDWVQF